MFFSVSLCLPVSLSPSSCPINYRLFSQPTVKHVAIFVTLKRTRLKNEMGVACK